MIFFKAFLLLFLSEVPAKAGVNFSAYGGGTSDSSHFTGTAGYDGNYEFKPDFLLDYFFSMKSGRSQFTTSFVEGLSETQTKTTKYGFSAGLTLFETFSVSYDFMNESINENAVLANEYTIFPSFHIDGFNLTYGYGKRKVHQQKPFLLLSRDIKDEIEFTQNSDHILLSYRFNESYSLSFSHTRFMYDKNMETSFTLLSNSTLASNNGTDMLSQIYSILDSTTEISGLYTIAEIADIELSFAKMIDFYHPKSETTDIRLGVLVYQTQALTWGLGMTSTRANSELTPSRSFDATFALAF